MGMYTELIFGAELKPDTPSDVLEILYYMLYEVGDYVFTCKETHKLFTTERWERMFNCSSYYFGVNEPINKMWSDDITGSFRLSIRCNLKNYNNEIELFLDWIKPFICQGSGINNMYAIVTYEEGLPTIYNLDDNCEMIDADK